MNFLNQKIEDYISNESDDTSEYFEYDGTFEYQFPFENDVPENWYLSKIMDVRTDKNQYHQPYVDVYYKIFSTTMFNDYNNYRTNEISYYYIKQRYMKHSTHYGNFISAMHKIVKSKKFRIYDLIGITEGFLLEYKKEGAIGSISQRRAMDIDDEYFAFDEVDCENNNEDDPDQYSDE